MMKCKGLKNSNFIKLNDRELPGVVQRAIK